MNQILITFKFVRFLMHATMDKPIRDTFFVEIKVGPPHIPKSTV